MSPAPSFEKVDYSIRTNKNIERKLIFERLQQVAREFPVNQYRYIGLGSMWFVDFSLAHRLLGVHDLWSFEKKGPQRAEYNKPYHCIEVKPVSSTQGLAALTPDDWLKPMIAWFDYDGPFTADVADDCRRLQLGVMPGSIVILTVNAQRRSYKSGAAADEGPPVLDKLKSLFGTAVPPNAAGDKADVGDERFPGVLRESILAFLTGLVRTSGRSKAGKPIRFVPLFDLLHVDGAPMVTVGGMVASDDDLVALAKCLGCEPSAVAKGHGILRRNIDLIPITIKEKIALDSLLPCSQEDFGARYSASGLKLDAEQAMKYRELYAHFPVFSETVA